jgi:hypothetical protein
MSSHDESCGLPHPMKNMLSCTRRPTHLFNLIIFIFLFIHSMITHVYVVFVYCTLLFANPLLVHKTHCILASAENTLGFLYLLHCFCFFVDESPSNDKADKEIKD